MKISNNYIPVPVKGKRILITDGTTGIGRAMAILLASQGARIMIFGRHQRSIDKTMMAIGDLETETECFSMLADVANKKDLDRIFYMVDCMFGGLDILINNFHTPFESKMEGTYEEWQYIINNNLLGYIACCNEAIKRMKSHQRGHIVNIGPIDADVQAKGNAVYVAAMAGIRGFNKHIRKEVNEHGLKVSLIDPGIVDSDMIMDGDVKLRKKMAAMEILKADDIAMTVMHCLSQPHTAISLPDNQSSVQSV
ncbi:SDR family oxidoreductase [Pedobacter steynii]|uniref:Oxidoreductase n=1 Tax=Pedobacter steynii TaxID=430522 RepID=A0A1D7QJN3_9SPHI|nr:SDR family oxidoreductase [Pedobacter steynii]AOM78871.1 oxidoreductase [Pedobacter steynii]